MKKNIRDWSANYIKKSGLLSFMKLTDLKFTKVYSIVGDDIFTTKIMIDFIKEIIEIYGGFGPTEIGRDPIFYGKTSDEYKEIDILLSKSVIIKVWDIDFQNIKGEFGLPYEILPKNIIQEIFDTVIDAYDDGRLENM
jgi:hypothetical protein